MIFIHKFCKESYKFCLEFFFTSLNLLEIQWKRKVIGKISFNFFCLIIEK